MHGKLKKQKMVTLLWQLRLVFLERVVADSKSKKGESLLASTPVVVLSSILGRIPSMEE